MNDSERDIGDAALLFLHRVLVVSVMWSLIRINGEQRKMMVLPGVKESDEDDVVINSITKSKSCKKEESKSPED